MRCEECGRTLTSEASRALGFGPVCAEALRTRGLIIGGGRPVRQGPMFPKQRRLRRRKPNPGQLPLDGMEPA